MLKCYGRCCLLWLVSCNQDPNQSPPSTNYFNNKGPLTLIKCISELKCCSLPNQDICLCLNPNLSLTVDQKKVSFIPKLAVTNDALPIVASDPKVLTCAILKANYKLCTLLFHLKILLELQLMQYGHDKPHCHSRCLDLKKTIV